MLPSHRLLTGVFAHVVALCCINQLAAQRCGVERWAVKTGTDADAAHVDLAHPKNATIADLIALPPPQPLPTRRSSPTETTVFVVKAVLTDYRFETGPTGDSDYHLVLRDEQGNTMIAEIPSPHCVGANSSFANKIAGARALFDSNLAVTPSFHTANVPVQVTGVGMFDFQHHQHGAAPNLIELHPVLGIVFNPSTTADSTIATGDTSSHRQWEYQVIDATSEQNVIAQADRLGAKGWEMVSVIRVQASAWRAFFKRLKP